ncbi:Protocadherin-10 [Platysternon megacephalum]|uniref:Protocadherin-10 n=1 Tax=Platysternon megacephalum TaxID=55544 RepID=A0A4D9F3J8_9SAUR|nr:Protocadherin-10 [Platysternon megacephalum]
MFLKPYSPSPPRNNEKAAENLPGPGRKPRAANNTASAASQPQFSLGNKVPSNCLDVAGSSPLGYCYKVCLTPESAKSDFMFLKPYSPSPPRNNEKAAENLPGPGRKPRAANNTASAASQVTLRCSTAGGAQ